MKGGSRCAELLERRAVKSPVKAGARVGFARGGNMFMTDHIGKRIFPAQSAGQICQHRILLWSKGFEIRPLQLYSD